MWRACHNILPTMANLFKRKMVETFLCPCCQLEEKTITHARWSCPASRMSGVVARKSSKNPIPRGATFLAIIEGFIGRFNGEDMALMAVLARRIWLRRNTLVFEGLFTPPSTVFSCAVENLQEYRLCMQEVQPVLSPPEESRPFSN